MKPFIILLALWIIVVGVNTNHHTFLGDLLVTGLFIASIVEGVRALLRNRAR